MRHAIPWLLLVTLSVSAAEAIKWKETSVLWRHMGGVARLNLRAGAGGTSLIPRPPYTFVEELGSGTKAKVRVRDVRGREWVVKWGREVHSETFASRLAWACGYFVEPACFVPRGVIRQTRNLKRAAEHILPGGAFRNARFQLWDPHLMPDNDWTWNNNPFTGTRALGGLKILVMLTSNWDNKDARDVELESNTAIQELRRKDGTREYRYLILDWGGSMGRTGLPGVRRNKWDCQAYAEQTPDFVKLKDGALEWGFTGFHGDIRKDVSVEDVRWLMQSLGGITDDQLRAALQASGATDGEVDCFTRAVRARIEALRWIAIQTGSSRPSRPLHLGFAQE
jgi:hypothetical protein